jgi:hypothetical protein
MSKDSYNAKYSKDWYKRNSDRVKISAKITQAKLKIWFYEYKMELKCSRCGEENPYLLDFHHTNPNDKDFDVASRLTRAGKKSIQEEIDKCIVLCSNCHRLEHAKEPYDSKIARIKKQIESLEKQLEVHTGTHRGEPRKCRVCDAIQGEVEFYGKKRICKECYKSEQKLKMRKRRRSLKKLDSASGT